MRRKRTIYALSSVTVTIAGIASRIFHSGLVLVDKYLGDALYAILAYLLLSLVWTNGSTGKKAIIVLAAMVAIEAFQLTLIPDNLAKSGDRSLRVLAVVLGTKFSWYDLLAYLAGIAGVYVLDRSYSDRT